MLANKKIRQWLMIGLSVLAAIVIVSLVINYLSYKSISFNLSSNVTSAVIYGGNYPEDGASAKITTVTASSDVRLKPGTYYIAPEGSTIITDTYEVTVDSSTVNIDVNPYFSTEYLSERFTAETEAINTLLRKTYSNIGGDYLIGQGTFYHFGEWYGTSLYKSPDANGAYDFYGVILHKVDGAWQIAAPPQLIFSYSDYPAIPKDIVYAVNAIVNGF